VNLYLGNSNSPSTNCGSEGGENFYNNNNNVHLNKNLHENIHKSYKEIVVHSRENSPRDNFRVDSPDKQRRADTCSPEESSRSFSSQKIDDVGSESPIHNHNNDSLGSQSPENLSSKHHHLNNGQHHHHSNNNNNNTNSNLNDMLDHKLNLSFLGPPLAALHSMTEMKSQTSPQQTSHPSQAPSNPHGIDSILSRPTPVTSSNLNALGGSLRILSKFSHTISLFLFSLLICHHQYIGAMPRFSIAAAAANMAQYLSQNQGAHLKSSHGALADRAHLYWPGLQGLVANPMAWRERLGSSKSFNIKYINLFII
jgi:hypothetical protein